MKHLNETLNPTMLNREKTMSKRVLYIVAVAGALALGGPALAAPPAKPAAKPAVKPAVKPAAAAAQQAQAPEDVAIETDCFKMLLPAGHIPFQRIKSASDPVLGNWGFIRAPHATTKIWVRCMPFNGKPIKAAADDNARKMQRWIANYQHQDTTIDKDEQGRDFAVTTAMGFTKAVDPKTKASVARRHVFLRAYMPFADRKLTISVTIAAAGKYKEDVVEMMTKIVESLNVVALGDRNKLKSAAKVTRDKVRAKVNAL